MHVYLFTDCPTKHRNHDHQKNQSYPSIFLALFWCHVAMVYLTSGGVSKVWNGAGEGTVHSNPSAPSQGLAGAGVPFPA
jgi:hypothetical protein